VEGRRRLGARETDRLSALAPRADAVVDAAKASVTRHRQLMWEVVGDLMNQWEALNSD
jgi:hypothetical protein